MHAHPVAGIGADIGIDAGRGRRRPAQLLRLARLQQRAGEQNLVRFRHEMARLKLRIRRARLGDLPKLFHRARPGEDKIVRHQIEILKQELDRFPLLDDDHFFVIGHAFRQGADADDAHAELAELDANLARLIDRQQGCQRIGEFQRVERILPGALLGRNLADMREHQLDQLDRLVVLGPILFRNALDRMDGGHAVGVSLDEFAQGLEGLGFLAAHGGERGHGSAADHHGGVDAPREGMLDLGCRRGLLEEDVDVLAGEVEDLERVSIEPFAERAIGAVVDHDGVDGEFGAEIDFPPGVGLVFDGMGLPAAAEAADLVAVDGSAGTGAIGGRALCRLAIEGDVIAIAVDFDLGQRQGPLLAGELDAHISPIDAFAGRILRFEMAWQASQQRLDLRIQAGSHTGIGDHRHRAEEVAQRRHRPRRQRPRLVGRTINVHQRHVAYLTNDRLLGAGRQLFQLAARLRQLGRASRGQHAHQIEDDVLVAVFLLVVDAGNGVQQHAHLGLVLCLCQLRDGLAAQLVAHAVAQQDFVVDILRALRFQELLVADIAQEEARAGVARNRNRLPLGESGFPVRIERALGFLHAVVEVVIHRLLGRDERHFDGVGGVEEARRPHRFETDARMLVVGQPLEQFERIGDLLALIAEDARRCRPGAVIGGRQHLLE